MPVSGCRRGLVKQGSIAHAPSRIPPSIPPGPSPHHLPLEPLTRGGATVGCSRPPPGSAVVQAHGLAAAPDLARDLLTAAGMEQHAVEAYRAELARLVEAKDPRTLDAEVLRGTVLFLFTDTATDVPARITVQIDETIVRVLPGAQSLEGRPVALIHAPFEAWLAYARSPDAAGQAFISIYGNLALLQSLSAVVQGKRNLLSARFFDLAPTASKSTSKRKRMSHVH